MSNHGLSQFKKVYVVTDRSIDGLNIHDLLSENFESSHYQVDKVTNKVSSFYYGSVTDIKTFLKSRFTLKARKHVFSITKHY